MDESFIKDEGEQIARDYVCPLCDDIVWTNEENALIVEIEVKQ